MNWTLLIAILLIGLFLFWHYYFRQKVEQILKMKNIYQSAQEVAKMIQEEQTKKVDKDEFLPNEFKDNKV